MNDLNDPSFFPTETGRVDNVEQSFHGQGFYWRPTRFHNGQFNFPNPEEENREIFLAPGKVRFIETCRNMLVPSRRVVTTPTVLKTLSYVAGEQQINREYGVANQVQADDEAHFWLNGYVDKQNYRISSEANPQVYVETPLHPEKLTVWGALWAGGILLQKR
ncbi:hypothetical protein TNCV_4433071 [Trichonephila clavipes]|nr:hypothetical protein TNCV_4433071 [Trichonephila clavipes]